MVLFGRSNQNLHELAPGDSLNLPVSFGGHAQPTQPGLYYAQAVMPALDLWSSTGSIVVLP